MSKQEKRLLKSALDYFYSFSESQLVVSFSKASRIVLSFSNAWHLSFSTIEKAKTSIFQVAGTSLIQ